MRPAFRDQGDKQGDKLATSIAPPPVHLLASRPAENK